MSQRPYLDQEERFRPICYRHNTNKQTRGVVNCATHKILDIVSNIGLYHKSDAYSRIRCSLQATKSAYSFPGPNSEQTGTIVHGVFGIHRDQIMGNDYKLSFFSQ
ncbi:uncharacterized protein LOC116178661 [Photinus pyralis]|uniref:uncharacterized protein LOC116178661 n=1 Tax=Photinus pyralis TaxID=7054 RepID=UPI0012674AEB|nr:uncharacterized protein LOC116178661 [Photinus pyralis]